MEKVRRELGEALREKRSKQKGTGYKVVEYKILWSNVSNVHGTFETELEWDAENWDDNRPLPLSALIEAVIKHRLGKGARQHPEWGSDDFHRLVALFEYCGIFVKKDDDGKLKFVAKSRFST